MTDISAQAADTESRMALADRQAAAYNVLAKTYGVALAGDPDTALKAQTFQQNEITNPLAVQQKQADLTGKNIENTGSQATNDYNALARPTILQGQKDTNAQTEQATQFAAQDQPGKIAQQKAQLASTNAEAGNASASAAATRYKTASSMSAEETSAASAMANQLLQVQRDGGDVEAAFNEMAPRIEAMPGVNKAHIESMRANLAHPDFLTNLSGQLGQLTVAQKGMVKLPFGDGSGYAMVPAASVPKAGPGVQSYVDPKTGQVSQRTIQQAQSPQALAIAKADLGQMDLQYDRTDKVLDTAISQVSGASTGFGAETIGRLPASQTKALEASIQAAKSNIALLTANLSRQGSKTGASAVPVRNMAEFKAYQDALGAVDIKASATVVRQQLDAVKTNLQALRGAVHDKFKATYGDAVSATSKPAAPQQSGGVQAGQTATGPNGQKIVFRNGQWAQQ